MTESAPYVQKLVSMVARDHSNDSIGRKA